jgi:hypothetical protein
MDTSILFAKRLASWCQDGSSNIPDPVAATDFINRHGLVTLYKASSEVPNLFWGYMGQADVKAQVEWDSDAGHVYTWRWELGHANAAFYGALVAKKPTWISWELLPLVLGFAMERRDPEDMYADGLLSAGAIRLVRAFEGSDGTLSTKELRARAGFPTGKPERAAYLKALEELELMLLVCKTFSPEGEGEDMAHSLVSTVCADAVSRSADLGAEDALHLFLKSYLPRAIYVDVKLFGKHLRLSPPLLAKVLETMRMEGNVTLADGLAIWTGE